ncbi:YfiR family protein [uncultured Thiohalocapsa sp.]|uniref:YfiR family protein n=1 Tax=uncultured Thiohalocapsa sp. TaxID=768990 RepID=UPI0025D1944B|nr:YfiR family protein [uncultured Thiohalocapsa sp.]
MLLLALAAVTPGARAADDPVLGLKVAYLYNFTHFITWPEDAIGSHFRITVLGDPAMATALQALEQTDRQVQGRHIRISTAAGDAVGSQILFIGAGATGQLPALLEATAARPVLLVADTPGLARRGVAINFFLRRDILGEGQRLRFKINPDNLNGRRLSVSAQLYDVAEIVR